MGLPVQAEDDRLGVFLWPCLALVQVRVGRREPGLPQVAPQAELGGQRGVVPQNP
jgi:hypothetical protein